MPSRNQPGRKTIPPIMTNPPSVRLRCAEERDLDVLVAFEQIIAKVTFGDEAIVDSDVHRQKLANALGREREHLIVAVDAEDRAIGFLWYAVNINFTTHDRYVNLRSLAVVPERPDGELIGEALLREGIAAARREGASAITSKVHVDNYAMRLLFRRVGLEPAILTVRARIKDLDGAAG